LFFKILLLYTMDCMWEMLLYDLSLMEDYEMKLFWMEILWKLFRPYRRDIVVFGVPSS